MIRPSTSVDIVDGDHVLKAGRRLLWRVARTLGNAGARWSWNDQFRNGYWGGLQYRRRTVVSLVEQLAGGGDIVEFGCGEGWLIGAVDPGVYRTYVGVDLSPVAIDVATRRARQAGLVKCRFEVGRFEHWSGGPDPSLIIMDESLYYLKPRRQRRLLRRCLDRLDSSCRMVVTVHSATRHRSTLEACRRAAVVEREVHDLERVILTLRARNEFSLREKAQATVATVRRVHRRRLGARTTVT